MAEQQMTEPAEGEEIVTEAPEGGEEGGQVTENEPITAESLASEMGWTPLEEWKGDPAQWRDAAEFIRNGHQIQRGLSRDLKEVRQSVEAITATNSQIMKDALERQKAELMSRYEQAVDDGDAAASLKIGQQIVELDSRAVTPATGPSPAALDFKERHSSWFMKDPLATERAVKLCAELEAQGYSEAYQLAAAERTIKSEFPQHFAQPKSAPGVNPPGRQVGGQGGKRGFAQLPPEAQKAALRYAEDHGVDKEVYARNYFNIVKKG